jgi:hypothetical protein
MTPAEGKQMHSVQAVSFAHSHTSSLVAALVVGLHALVMFGLDAEADTATGDSTSTCVSAFDPDADYPLLSEQAGPDVSGEPGVVVHLQHSRGVVELGDCLYEIDRPLELDVSGYDMISILLELHGDATGDNTLFVSTGAELETYSVTQTELLFTMDPNTTMGFELGLPGQAAPTIPVVIAKPVDEPPPPR